MTVEQPGELWGTLFALGAEQDESPSPPALDWLLLRSFVENQSQGPRLTPKGWDAFKALETGEGAVPDIDGTDLEV